jgi:hypothetical protein
MGMTTPHEVMIGVVNHVVVDMAATPHGWLLMILIVQEILLFLALGMVQVQDNELWVIHFNGWDIRCWIRCARRLSVGAIEPVGPV